MTQIWGGELGLVSSIMLLSCDLCMIQPVDWPDSTTSGYLHFIQNKAIFNIKSRNENQKLLIGLIFILLHSVQ